MGGKNAAIIFKDCDLNKTINTTVKSSFNNQGQICLCTSRIFVEDSVYEKFKQKFVEKVSSLKIGDPMDINTDFGSLVSKDQKNKVIGFIKEARSSGGKMLCGGEDFPVMNNKNISNGFFVKPTVFEGLSNFTNTNQQEIFGPVVCLIPFSSELEVLKLVNESNFGLATSIWTNNLQRAHKLSELIEVGIVWINTWMLRDLRTPFGGVKNSGVGREGGLEIMRFFTEPKNICINYKE
jgi:aminomuconate-semialdehyde/2-hydroxymuconate-6-semialdehyde dehydrogenase